MKTYEIRRFFFEKNCELIRVGLSLKEAQAHCKNKETSSRTCSQEKLERVGSETWFDGYAEE